MKLQKLSLLFTCSCILVLTGCTATPEKGSTLAGPTGPIELKSPSEVLRNTPDSIRKNPVFQACFAKLTQDCEWQVALQYAQEWTIESCDNFTNETLRNSCATGVNIELARKSGDLKYCNNFSVEYKKLCITQASITRGISEKSLSPCNSIVLQEEKSPTGWVIQLWRGELTQCIEQILRTFPKEGLKKDLCKVITEPLGVDICASAIDAAILRVNIPLLPQK